MLETVKICIFCIVVKNLNVVLTVTVYGCLFRKTKANPKPNKHDKASSSKSPRV